jgi:hypothetical protein
MFRFQETEEAWAISLALLVPEQPSAVQVFAVREYISCLVDHRLTHSTLLLSAVVTPCGLCVGSHGSISTLCCVLFSCLPRSLFASRGKCCTTSQPSQPSNAASIHSVLPQDTHAQRLHYFVLGFGAIVDSFCCVGLSACRSSSSTTLRVSPRCARCSTGQHAAAKVERGVAKSRAGQWTRPPTWFTVAHVFH